MGRPGDAPPPPFEGVELNHKTTQPRSTAFPHSQDYSEVQQFPPSQPVNQPAGVPHGQDYDRVQQFPPSQPVYQPASPAQFPPSQPVYQPASPAPFIPPNPQLPNQLPNQGWKTGLFDCMQDPQNAIITACFPCVTFGQIAEIVDSGTSTCATSGMWYSLISFCIAMPCIMSCTYRTKMRAKLGLVEDPAPDWLVHCFCEWCALCQEYRELKERGYDPTIGWAGNMAIQRQQQQASMAPPMHQRMM